MSQPNAAYGAETKQWQPTLSSDQRRRTKLLVFVVAVVAMAASIAIAAVIANRPIAGEAVAQAAPAAISRAQLMSEYAKMVPLDKSATPDTMDQLAQQVCGRLHAGLTSDYLISNFTETYASNATRVVQLLVSYKCPEFLKDFK